MHTIELKPLFHNQAEQIGIYFAKEAVLELRIRKIEGVKWSQTHRCWYLPLSKESHVKIKEQLLAVAIIKTDALKTFLQKRKQVAKTLLPLVNKSVRPVSMTVAWKLIASNLNALNRFVEELTLRAYSASTIKTYRNEFMQLLQLLKNKKVDDLGMDELRRYFVYCFEKLKLTENTMHSRINAIKFYFEQVLKREKFFWEIPRPKKAEKLPNVLGEKEVIRLFRALNNSKHKAILFTAYSAGLRVSEVVGLQLKNIDSDRMQIKVVAGKGKKDRYVTLSSVLLAALRTYIRSVRQRPAVFLFESETLGTPYSSRSAQKLFQRAKAKAGIRKDVSFHCLRHSFATHLLEKGIDIRFIKDILGHESIQTTEKYTHVAREQIVQIRSPLDDLWLKGDMM